MEERERRLNEQILSLRDRLESTEAELTRTRTLLNDERAERELQANPGTHIPFANAISAVCDHCGDPMPCELHQHCPVCGCEQRGQGDYLLCECPAPLKSFSAPGGEVTIPTPTCVDLILSAKQWATAGRERASECKAAQSRDMMVRDLDYMTACFERIEKALTEADGIK